MKEKIEGLGAFKYKAKDKPILQELRELHIDTTNLNRFLDDYAEIILWMNDCICIQKARGKEFPDLSKERAFYEGQSSITDLFNILRAEFAKEQQEVMNTKAEKATKKRYEKV